MELQGNSYGAVMEQQGNCRGTVMRPLCNCRRNRIKFEWVIKKKNCDDFLSI